MIKLPDHISQLIKDYCKSNKLGSAMATDEANNVSIIIMGPEDMNPNLAALIVSMILIGGVIEGAWSGENLEMIDIKDSKTH